MRSYVNELWGVMMPTRWKRVRQRFHPFPRTSVLTRLYSPHRLKKAIGGGSGKKGKGEDGKEHSTTRTKKQHQDPDKSKGKKKGEKRTRHRPSGVVNHYPGWETASESSDGATSPTKWELQAEHERLLQGLEESDDEPTVDEEEVVEIRTEEGLEQAAERVEHVMEDPLPEKKTKAKGKGKGGGVSPALVEEVEGSEEGPAGERDLKKFEDISRSGTMNPQEMEELCAWLETDLDADTRAALHRGHQKRNAGTPASGDAAGSEEIGDYEARSPPISLSKSRKGARFEGQHRSSPQDEFFFYDDSPAPADSSSPGGGVIIPPPPEDFHQNDHLTTHSKHKRRQQARHFREHLLKLRNSEKDTAITFSHLRSEVQLLDFSSGRDVVPSTQKWRPLDFLWCSKTSLQLFSEQDYFTQACFGLPKPPLQLSHLDFESLSHSAEACEAYMEAFLEREQQTPHVNLKSGTLAYLIGAPGETGPRDETMKRMEESFFKHWKWRRTSIFQLILELIPQAMLWTGDLLTPTNLHSAFEDLKRIDTGVCGWGFARRVKEEGGTENRLPPDMAEVRAAAEQKKQAGSQRGAGSSVPLLQDHHGHFESEIAGVMKRGRLEGLKRASKEKLTESAFDGTGFAVGVAEELENLLDHPNEETASQHPGFARSAPVIAKNADEHLGQRLDVWQGVACCRVTARAVLEQLVCDRTSELEDRIPHGEHPVVDLSGKGRGIGGRG